MKLRDLHEGLVRSITFHNSIWMKEPKTVRVWENPSPSQLKQLALNSKYQELRGIVVDQDTVWWWDSYDAEHEQIKDGAAEEGIRIDRGTDPNLYMLVYDDDPNRIQIDGIDQVYQNRMMQKYARSGLFLNEPPGD